MAKSTAQNILNYLEHHQPATCSQIGYALGISRANAHYHICKFIEQGLVEQLPMPLQHKHRGRPTIQYRISQQPNQNALLHLVDCLLEEMINSTMVDEGKQKKIVEIARRMAPDLGFEKLSLPRYLNSIIFSLNEKGYKANWESHRDGPVITFRNCPYLPVVACHPMMCQIDIQILREMLGSAYLITDTILRNEAPDTSNICRFVLINQ